MPYSLLVQHIRETSEAGTAELGLAHKLLIAVSRLEGPNICQNIDLHKGHQTNIVTVGGAI